MANLKEIEPSALERNVFDLIGSDWMLVTAGDESKLNTMTASWGALGVMWGKPAATIYLRPQRYTKEFVDSHDHFTLGVFDESWRKQLGYLGTVSGRDEDKIAHAGLTPVFDEAAPYFQEASLVLVCRKAYAQELQDECFIDRSHLETWYPEHDLHTLYIGIIEKALVRE